MWESKLRQTLRSQRYTKSFDWPNRRCVLQSYLIARVLWDQTSFDVTNR